jgi:HlyD family secretion protein
MIRTKEIAMTTASTTADAPLRPSAPATRRSNHATRRAIMRWSKRGALAVLGAGGIAAIVHAWLPTPVEVDVASARRATLEVEIDEDGQTRVLDRFVVSAPITGNLERIDLEAGAAISAGAPLARIRPPDPILLDRRSRDEATARLATATAHRRQADTVIARATAARDAAIREADRARKLAEHGAITASERERDELAERLAREDLAAAELTRTAATAEVDAARAVLGPRGGDGPTATFTVTAPAAGQVLRVVRDSAGPVAAGQPLLELGDARKLEVVIDVLSSDAAQITPGMDVSLEGWGGAPLRGHVRVVEPSAFTRISALGVEEQRVKVIAGVDAPPSPLGDGFRVDARVITWRGDVLAVPASAVFRVRGRWAVYTVEDGRARLRPIELGHRGRLDVEIVRGLADHAVVILHPSDRVGDGVEVAPRDDERGAGP